MEKVSAIVSILFFLQGCLAGPSLMAMNGVGAGALEPYDAPECASEGQLLCLGCSALGVCVSEGKWLAVQDCSAEGLVCWRSACEDAAVAAAEGATCDAGAGCFAAGFFPQLDDCSRYVECAAAAGQGAERSCPIGARFDACTGRCDVLSAGDCAWEVAPGAVCARVGEYGVAPENDRLYYSCVAAKDGGIEQWWSRCELGHFDLNLLRCVDLDVPGCRGSGDETAPTPTTKTTSEPTTTIPTTTQKCSAGLAYPRPDTNCSYLFCLPDGNYMVITCNGGFHFDATQGMCVGGECKDWTEEDVMS